MDESPTGILAIVGVIVSVGTMLLGIINHQRVRSNCCGKIFSVSLDVERTTPPASSEHPEGLKITAPKETV